MPRPFKIVDDQKRPPLSVDEVMLALAECGGNVSAAAEYLDRPRWRVQTLINETPTLQILMQDIEGSVVDKAVENIHDAVFTGDFNASRLVVTTLGKDRGWNTRSEVTGKDGGSVVVNIEGPDANL